jgi:hypothetical protein
MIMLQNCAEPACGYRAADSFEEVSCVDWRNALRHEAATKRKRQPEIVR